MNRRTIGIAVLAAVLTFGIVAIGVTELLASSIEFSAIVGLPAGIFAGIAALLVTIVYMDQQGRGGRPDDATTGIEIVE